ncbi:hypothetical protein Tco_0138121 [Tanacetum coccineum]
MESLNSNSQERELHQLQQMQDNAKESCMTSFQLLHSFLQVLSYDESKSRRVSERAFMTLFGQDNETFTSTMFLYVDQLQNQLDKDEFHEDQSMAAFWVLYNQFQKFIDWQYFLDYDSEMTEKLFAEYTGIQVKQFRETLLLHMGNVKKSVAERTRHKRQYDRRMNERQMQSRESKDVSSKALDASLVVTECSGTKSDVHITSSSSGTYIIHVVDADIRPVNDQVPSAEVHLTVQHNVLANEQQHTDQSEPSYDTYLLEKVDSNTTPDSTNMSHRGGEIDQDAEQDQVKSPLLKAEFLKTNDMVEKEVYNELSNRFLQLEKHCISLEISMQQKEESFQSNKPSNEQLHKENEHLKQTYKELYDSIKKTRVQNKDNSDSLISQINQKSIENVDLKSQIQEKVQSTKTRNNNKPVVPKSHTQKPGRQIAIGQRFSPKKSSAVHEKPNTSRSCLRWKPTGRIFKIAGLRWIPTGKMFTDNTTKVDSEPSNGSNDDITNSSECDQTLNVSAGTTNLSAVQASLFNDKMTSVHISSSLALQRHMASADNTSGPAAQRKERCTLQCALSSKEEKSSSGVQEPVVSIGTPSSTRIDQDTPSTTVVAEKQAGYVQTNLTLSSAELEIQSMVDVPIHQEDLAVQRTPLIDPIISMTFQEEFRSAGWCKENSDGQKTVAEDIDACPNAMEMWKANERLKQDECSLSEIRVTILINKFECPELTSTTKPKWAKVCETVKAESRAEDCLLSITCNLYAILQQHQNEVNDIKN